MVRQCCVTHCTRPVTFRAYDAWFCVKHWSLDVVCIVRVSRLMINTSVDEELSTS